MPIQSFPHRIQTPNGGGSKTRFGTDICIRDVAIDPGDGRSSHNWGNGNAALIHDSADVVSDAQLWNSSVSELVIFKQA